jgi:hypothetical protein
VGAGSAKVLRMYTSATSAATSAASPYGGVKENSTRVVPEPTATDWNGPVDRMVAFVDPTCACHPGMESSSRCSTAGPEHVTVTAVNPEDRRAHGAPVVVKKGVGDGSRHTAATESA